MKSLLLITFLGLSSFYNSKQPVCENQVPSAFGVDITFEQGDCKVTITGSCGSESCWGSNCDEARACAWAKYNARCFGA